MQPVFPKTHCTVSVQFPRYCAVALFVALAAFILITFRQYGISNDEEVQRIYGQLLLRYYQSGLTDPGAFHYKNLFLYGGLFDLIAAGLEQGLPHDNIWDLRHLLSAVFGLAGFAGVWLLAHRLAGAWAALFASLLLLVTGAWTGAMFTHTKDVPFATAMIWTLYFMTRLLPDLPKPRQKDVTGFGLALGCAFGLRVGAVFAVFYFAVSLLFTAWAREHNWRTRSLFLLQAMKHCLPALLIACVLTAFFWPWVIQSPFNLFTAITTFSKFSFEIDTILDGNIMRNGAVPGTYMIHYLIVRLPELFLFALALSLFTGIRTLPALYRDHDTRLQALPWSPVLLAAAFPIFYTLTAAPPLYNGIRHFTFLLPPLAVLGGAGIASSLRVIEKHSALHLLMLSACILALTFHVVTLLRLHPYEYVAYNMLTGGIAGTTGRWEQDYWAATTREAASLLNHYIAAENAHPDTPYKVAVCAEPIQAASWLSSQFTVTRDWKSADFFIAPTQMNCDKSLKGTPIIEIMRDNTVLGLVRDRRHLTGQDRIPQ